MKNHDQFNLQTVAILSHLYKLFPAETEIDSSKSDNPALLTQTIDFWKNSDFIRVGQTAEAFNGGAHFFFVGLTLTGLAVLRSPWTDSGPPSMTIGERLAELDLESDTTGPIADMNFAVSELLKHLTN